MKEEKKSLKSADCTFYVKIRKSYLKSELSKFEIRYLLLTSQITNNEFQLFFRLKCLNSPRFWKEFIWIVSISFRLKFKLSKRFSCKELLWFWDYNLTKWSKLGNFSKKPKQLFLFQGNARKLEGNTKKELQGNQKRFGAMFLIIYPFGSLPSPYFIFPFDYL